MALTGVRYDDGTQGGFATNCFPVRTFHHQSEEAGGAWLVAHKAEQRRQFKALLCSKPRSYQQIRDERKRAENDDTGIAASRPTEETDEDENKVLDGFLLMKHCCVEDPSDLCSVNVSGLSLSDAKDEDFILFDNVAYVNASENLLPLEPLKYFPIIRELELSLNGLRNVKLSADDFQHLEMLDLSFNNLSPDDLLALGLLQKLRVLNVSGNNLKTLPPGMTRPETDPETYDKIQRFSCLEILLLEDNKLSDTTTFSTLAGLRRLKQLNLTKNQITCIPQLMLVEGRHVTQQAEHGSRKKPKSSRKEKKTRKKTENASDKMVAENVIDLSQVINKASQDNLEDSKAENLESSEAVEVKIDENQAEETSRTDATALDSLQDLDLDELDLKDLDAKIQAAESLADDHGTPVTQDAPQKSRSSHQKEVKGLPFTTNPEKDAFQRPGYDGNLPLPTPFPELRHLNVSHNKIAEEEDLLAVAAWPMLSELIFHDNPLIDNRSGDPPLLKRFLNERLGIHLERKRPPPVGKPSIEMPQKPERKVKSKVPKVPKVNVEQLLALEAPRRPLLVDSPATPQASSRAETPTTMAHHKPLPRIPTADGGENTIPQSSPASRENYDGDAFFMTQVDEPETTASEKPTPDIPHSPAAHRVRRKEHKRPKDATNKHKGYEIFFEDTDTVHEDLPAKTDVIGNLRSLQYSLNHPLVYREHEKDLDQPQKPFRTSVKVPVPPNKAQKSKQQKIGEALDNLKNRSTVVEEDLAKILRNRRKYKKDFREAKDLLGQLKSSYDSPSGCSSPCSSSLRGCSASSASSSCTTLSLAGLPKHTANFNHGPPNAGNTLENNVCNDGFKDWLLSL